MPVTASSAAEPSHRSPARRLLLGAWCVFAALNATLMWLMPGLETIPFHLIWISMAIVYGLQAWSLPWAATTCVIVAIVTAAPLTDHAQAGAIGFEEIAEVPLMSALFLVMVWHVRLRNAALVTARRSAEREHVATRMQQRFVQLASHELRTPITVARGYTEVLREDSTDPRLVEDTSVVLDELGKLDRIAGRLLALAWAHDPKGDDVVDIATLLYRVARRWGPVAGPALHAEAAPSVVLGDEDRLETALDCLVENAMTHTCENPSIVLRAHHDGAWAVIEVEDDGPGLPRDPAAAPPDDPPANHGLGLTIVRGVVDAHGGDLRFDNVRSGGLRVTIRLPLAPYPGPPIVVVPPSRMGAD